MKQVQLWYNGAIAWATQVSRPYNKMEVPLVGKVIEKLMANSRRWFTIQAGGMMEKGQAISSGELLNTAPAGYWALVNMKHLTMEHYVAIHGTAYHELFSIRSTKS